MGGGGGRGGGMLRAVGKTVGGAGVGGVQEAFSASTTRPYKPTTTNLLSLPSNSSSTRPYKPTALQATSTASATWPSSSSSGFYDCDDWELESLEGGAEERANGFYDQFVFGPVPSKDEVEDAVSSLQQVLATASYSELVGDRFVSSSDKDIADRIVSPTGLKHIVSSEGPVLDLIEPTHHLSNPRILQSRGCGRVNDAFRLLHTQPTVQRLVVSLSTDKAVWDAVLNNEVVREYRDSFFSAENNRGGSSDGSPDPATSIMRWILDNTKAILMELIEKITKLVNEMFQPPERDKTTSSITDLLEETLRSSLFLSVVIFLIIVVTRAHRK